MFSKISLVNDEIKEYMEENVIDDYFFITKGFNKDYIYVKDLETKLSNEFHLHVPTAKNMAELCWFKCQIEVNLVKDLINLDDTIGRFSVKSTFMPSCKKFNDLLMFGSVEFEKKYGKDALWNDTTKTIYDLDLDKFKIENSDIVEEMENKVKIWLTEKVKSSAFDKREIEQLEFLRDKFKVTAFNNMIIKTDKVYLLLEQCKSRKKYGELKQKVGEFKKTELFKNKI